MARHGASENAASSRNRALRLGVLRMNAAIGTKIDIRRGSAPVGAEIVGVDLAQALDESTFERIRGAYSEHSVIVLRDQNLTPAQQIAFSRRFGELEIHRRRSRRRRCSSLRMRPISSTAPCSPSMAAGPAMVRQGE